MRLRKNEATRNVPTDDGRRRLVVSALTHCALVVALLSTSAQAALLPAPGTVVNGIPVSQQFDDAYSYPTRLLDYLYPGSGWSNSAGTGLLDVIVTTRSSGQTNSGIAGGIYNIPDPTTNPNTNPIVDSWGTSATTGPMLVKDLYNYLWNTFGANTPVFTFDQNETGGNPDLLVNAKVEIIDAAGNGNGGAPGSGLIGGVLYTWSFDGTTQPGDGTYDAMSYVTALGHICIPDVMDAYNPPGTGDTVCFDNNVGGGKFDYMVYAPTMDLSRWDDNDNLFKVSWQFADVDDGGEEITITGRFAGNVCAENPNLPQCQTVPEPGTLALVGLAMLGFGTVRGRQGRVRTGR